MHKYPRTHHVVGSRRQAGDDDLGDVPLGELARGDLVIEEKIDGANSGVRFGADGALLLQSRGHYLTGGPRERHFQLFKTWANRHVVALRALLGTRYVMFGEWVYAKHTIFYDRLPHYFLEFDLWDTEGEVFLCTDRRREVLEDGPVVSVPVVHRGAMPADLASLVKPSVYKGDRWRESLEDQVRRADLDVERALRETDPSDLSEGLYIKVEAGGCVRGRYKYVRGSFLDVVAASGGHWHSRPIVPNCLAPGVDLFA